MLIKSVWIKKNTPCKIQYISVHYESWNTQAVVRLSVEREMKYWDRLRIEGLFELTYSPEMSSSWKYKHNIEASWSRWFSWHISYIDFLSSSSGYISRNTHKSFCSAATSRCNKFKSLYYTHNKTFNKNTLCEILPAAVIYSYYLFYLIY